MARAAVEKFPSVDSVKTDMRKHTLTVQFDDDKTSLDEIVQALAKAGYTVPSYQKSD